MVYMVLLSDEGFTYGCSGILIMGFIALIVLGVLGNIDEKKKLAKLTPKERADLDRIKRDVENDKIEGSLNDQMVCPHCQTKGCVRTKKGTVKTGISGGKATAAVLTGGVSLVATGLSKKSEVTRAKCSNCKCEWTF